MKTDSDAPLAGTGCCRFVTEYHQPTPEAGPDMPQPGEVLDDRFLITEVISRSGMAYIFKAQDTHRDNADVAIKVPHMTFECDVAFSTRFKREEEIGLKLDHPHVIRFIEVATPKSRPYIVTEYLRGCTLAHLMEAMSPMLEADALTIASRLCEALEYLHRNGIIHRDLKPQNVMIGCDGSLRVLDFGIAAAKSLRRVTFAALTPAMGTPDYMAPEQVKGRRGDARTDLYSLGAILYEMLTGRVPFEADNSLCAMNARVIEDPVPLREINPAVSPEVEDIVLHAMERDPARRQPSARALQRELDNPLAVPSAGRCNRTLKAGSVRRGLMRYRTVIMAVGLPLVLQVATALWLWLRV